MGHVILGLPIDHAFFFFFLNALHFSVNFILYFLAPNFVCYNLSSLIPIKTMLLVPMALLHEKLNHLCNTKQYTGQVQTLIELPFYLKKADNKQTH